MDMTLFNATFPASRQDIGEGMGLIRPEPKRWGQLFEDTHRDLAQPSTVSL